MLLCFHSFSCFENRDTTGDTGDMWEDMRTSSIESGSSSFVEITKQQTGSKNLNLSLMPTEQHLSMGQQYPALVINWEPWAKAAAELRNYEEDPFFSKCSGSSDPVEYSAYLGNCNPSVAASQEMKDFVSL